MNSQSWPESIWDAPLLRPLDARARSEITAAGRLRSSAKGEVLHRVGEPADMLSVVVRGRYSLHATRRGEGDAREIRRAGPGEIFGEEGSVVAFGVRQAEARCVDEGVVAEIPVSLVERALGRLGGSEVAARQTRALKRAATMDLLRTTSFTRDLPERDVEMFLDAAKHLHVARGEHVYRPGDVADAAYLVADGLLSAQSEDDGKPRVEAYLSHGDIFGDAELEDHGPRVLAVVANGPTWLVAIPREVFLGVARRHTKALAAARRLTATGLPPRLPGGAQTTAHVFQDLYRMRVARSLLVIDQNSCVRCGHCAWSCADVHDDGISRLIRHGERIVAEAKSPVPFLVPNSCQHCKNPACMIDCPTGAIGRDARGEVFIREDLCTGCGSCAKACPWDNISMAARPAKEKSPYPDVAVKCDLCSGLAGGPACVSSCPTEAIQRIDPNDSLVVIRKKNEEAPPILPPRLATWPWVVGAGFASAGMAAFSLSKWTSGIVVGTLVLALVSYAAIKRTPRIASRFRTLAQVARIAYLLHLAFGIGVIGTTLAHAGIPHAFVNLTGTLLLAMIGSVVAGLFGAVMYAIVPRRLARLERKSVLPEALSARAAELDAKLFAALSGKGELVKTLYARALRPYHRARLGAFWLILGGRSLRNEEKRLRAKLDVLLGENASSERTAGLDELVSVVVERRAIGAQVFLTRLLRAWIAPHVAASAAAFVLLIVHIVQVVRAR